MNQIFISHEIEINNSLFFTSHNLAYNWAVIFQIAMAIRYGDDELS